MYYTRELKFSLWSLKQSQKAACRIHSLLHTNAYYTRFHGNTIRYNTIPDAILTCAQKPTWVSLIYSTEHTHAHTHPPFNGPLSGTTQVSRYQKGKTNLDFTEARDSEWQWNLLGHHSPSAPRSRQITTPAPHRSVFTGRMPFLSPNQQC